jgi:hypothetical protein
MRNGPAGACPYPNVFTMRKWTGRPRLWRTRSQALANVTEPAAIRQPAVRVNIKVSRLDYLRNLGRSGRTAPPGRESVPQRHLIVPNTKWWEKALKTAPSRKDDRSLSLWLAYGLAWASSQSIVPGAGGTGRF